MKEVWLKLKEWWMNLSLREKQVVTLGGSLLILFILYQGIWAPLLNAVATKRKHINTEQKTLLWMQSADAQIQKIESKPRHISPIKSPVVLLGLIQKRLQHKGLEKHLTQLKQSSNESIDMHFQKVEFDKLISVLTTLVKEQQVSISQMSVVADNAQGLVDADIVIKLINR